MVKIGLIEAAVYTLLPELIKRLNSELKNVSVTWVVGLTADLLEQLYKGELDLVLSLDLQPQNQYAISEKLMTLPTKWIAKTGLVRNLEGESFIFSHQILAPMSNTSPTDEIARTARNMAFKYGVSPTVFD